jgi:glucosamine 6-phosphate synthetase-like amidotransferase/phosphosugar isomerase protein
MNNDDINVMMAEIELIPGVMQKCLSDEGGHIRKLAQKIVDTNVQHLWLTGCGDSGFAGSAAALAFIKASNLYTRGIHALDLARYEVRYLPENSLVIGLSFSGKVGRTTEAALQVQKFGHKFVALTNVPHGPLGKAADEILPIDVPILGFSPGTSSYVGMLMTLYTLAGEIADIKGSREFKEALMQMPKLAEETLKSCKEPALEAAKVIALHEWIAFIGAGPNEATAKFGAAKLFEGSQQIGISTNIEEWAHEEYFVTKENSPVVVVAPSGASVDRAREIISEIDFLSAKAVVISDENLGFNSIHLPISKSAKEELSPLLTCLPLALIGFYLADLRGKKSYNFKDEETKIEHYETIHRITIGDPA